MTTTMFGQPKNLVGVVFVILDGERYSMEYRPIDEVIPLPRRALVHGLRRLADAWAVEAEKVGD
jgi:hypothetical protein